MSEQTKTALFRTLHQNGPLVLPNAWDPASARVIEAAGAPAIATTSAGVSWALGYGDGEHVSREEMVQAVARIVRVVDVPVNADVEGGYGDVGTTVRELAALGVAGVNVEDTEGFQALETSLAAQRIELARKADADLVINARTDLYLFGLGDPATRFENTVARALAYLNAGADCVFVPGVADAETIAALVREIPGPVNVMAGPGSPEVAELARLGVARISVGSGIAQAALSTVDAAARELLTTGGYQRLADGLPFGTVNGLFA